jgi:hypothetical protein
LDAATADASAIHFAPDQRVNLGCWVLDSLLSEWAAVEKQRIRGGEDYEPNSQENKQPGGSSLESINGAAGPTEDASTTFNSQPNSPVLPRLFGRKQSASSTAASDASNHPKGDAGKIIAPTRSSSIIESAAIQRRQSNRPLHKEKVLYI